MFNKLLLHTSMLQFSEKEKRSYAFLASFVQQIECLIIYPSEIKRNCMKHLFKRLMILSPNFINLNKNFINIISILIL